MHSSAYRVLRAWKNRGGSAFTRFLLKQRGDEIQSLAADAITFLPQAFHRSWRLGRSPAEELASEIGRILRKPVWPVLEARTMRTSTVQHHSDLWKRETSGNRFRVAGAFADRVRGKNLLLVDDFLTTGRTLRQAAQALRLAGAGKLFGFTLGCRARWARNEPQGDADLLKRQAEAETIGKHAHLPVSPLERSSR